MAEDEDLDEDVESEDGEDGESQPKKGGKKTLFIIIGVAVLLLLGVGGALFVFLPDSATETTVEDEVEGEPEEPLPAEEVVLAPPVGIFYELPELLVDMNDISKRTAFLRLKLTLALAEESDRVRAEKQTPRIVDQMLAYLREVRAEELYGSAGMHRLREELLKRAAIAMAPAKVEDVLFTEVLLQ
ncbi:MAG: flagellar basal body-associated FliL family protein [Rhodospirillales bacterium]|nr:flagellar basal body-associated FliL family protein [Rhodospirillales bacterium]